MIDSVYFFFVRSHSAPGTHDERVHTLGITPLVSHRTYAIEAASQAERDAWLAALQRAIDARFSGEPSAFNIWRST